MEAKQQTEDGHDSGCKPVGANLLKLFAAGFLFAMCGASLCAAQDADGNSGEVLSFLPEYFDEFRPNTVTDMLDHLPGFSYNQGDSNVRGAAGSGGNVLVDGTRPNSKSLSLNDILRRLPLEAIERIDLIRGNAPGIDMQGQPMVANIIRKPGGYTVATAELWTKLYTNHRPARLPRFELSHSWGDWTASGALSWRDEREQSNTGTGGLTRQDLITGERQYAPFAYLSNETRLNANLGIEYSSGSHLLRLNASGERKTEDRNELLRTIDVSEQEEWQTDEQENSSEFSLDYEYRFPTDLTGRLMLLRRAKRERKESVSDIRGAGQQADEDNLSRETIARLSMSYVPAPTLTLEASAEGTRNTLDASSSLERDGIPVVLPSANIHVAETRGNFTTSARWQAAAGTALEFGTGWETSTISQSGDASDEKTLQYWKPYLNLTLDPLARLQIRLRGERTVSQLDFDDFAASVSTEPGVTSAGNPDLVPETGWLGQLAVEQRFWERGALVLTAKREYLADVVDLIPVDNRFDAPGNIGDGWRQTLTFELNLPTDRLAVPGGEVRLVYTKRNSSVTDPVTGETRRIRAEWPRQLDLQLSKNLPGLNSTLGVDFFLGYAKNHYRLRELRTERSSSSPLGRLRWDWTPDNRTYVRFQIENFTFRSRGRTRLIYQGTRASGLIAGIEDREVTMDPFFMIRLRRRL